MYELKPLCLLLQHLAPLTSEAIYSQKNNYLVFWIKAGELFQKKEDLFVSIFHLCVFMEIRFDMGEAVGLQHWESLSNQACEVADVGFLCQRKWGEVEEIITLAFNSWALWRHEESDGEIKKKKKLLRFVTLAQHTYIFYPHLGWSHRCMWPNLNHVIVYHFVG